MNNSLNDNLKSNFNILKNNLTKNYTKGLNKFNSMNNSGKLFVIIIIILVIFILVVVSYITNKLALNNINCLKMDNMYSKNPSIGNINVNNQNYKYSLRDYYVKSAYNACSAGNFKNDYVNICALKNCIKQGFRMLDFEIYNINDEPVISTSSVNNYKTKGTYNSIPFSQVLSIINNYAFSNGTCPNPNDPLIVHLRVKSNNKKIYSKMADMIYNTLEGRLLGPNYSYENNGNNLGNVKLSQLLGKVILSVNKENPLFEDTPLNEYVNIASHTPLLRCLRYNDIYNNNDINELTNFNKKCMTICIPNLSINVGNYPFTLPMKYGCQFVAMSAQGKDNFMREYNNVFNNAGSAFILKPKNLRYIPVTIAHPKLPPKKYSYASRNISSNYYNFKI
jgi:hypothetical protein